MSVLLIMWIGTITLASFFPILASTFAMAIENQRGDCECGMRNHDSLSFLPRGIFSEDHAWPWMASIVNVTLPESPVAYCGGTLINDRYILTAAHCVPDMLDTGIRNFRIYLGTNKITTESDLLNLEIRKIISHHSFDYESADSDVSLIKLSESVIFNSDVSPVCLRWDKKSYVGDTGYITGWGSYNLTESTERSLKEAEAHVVSNDICSKNYSSVDIPITDNMICATLPVEDDPCKGDSGGPLVVKANSEDRDVYTQIGIISHGLGCAVPNYPAIFSKVSSFIGWIKQNTKDAVYCSGTFSS